MGTTIKKFIPYLFIIVGMGLVAYFFIGQAYGNIKAESTHAQGLEQMREKFASATPQPEPTPTAKSPGHGEVYATLRIPRFDSDKPYAAPIAEGTSRDVIDYKGVGHYESTAQFGQTGNVGLAAHRNGDGALLSRITELQKGDKIFVDTSDGTYTYVYDSQEQREPTDVDVLEPVPNHKGEKAKKQVLTLTTCEWWDASKRVVAYAHFESFHKVK